MRNFATYSAALMSRVA